MSKQQKNDVIDLSRVIYLLSKHIRTLLILLAAGMALGLALSGVNYLKKERTPRHVITCSFAVVTKNKAGDYLSNNVSPGYNDVKLAESITEAVIFVGKSDRVLSAAVEKLHLLGVSNDEIRKNLTIEQNGDTQILTLKLKWINATEGLNLVQAICDVIPGTLIETLDLGSVSVVDYPKDKGAEQPGVDWKYAPMLMILFAGLFIGIQFLLYLIHPTLTDIDTVERELGGVECFGIIPDDEAYFTTKPFSIAETTDISHYQVIEALISTAHVIKNLVEREGFKCFYITSSEAGEGKTGITANLAIELSKREKRVLLIDMDTRRPALGSCFFEKIDHEHSLNAVYAGTVEVADAVISVSDTLDVLLTRFEKESVRIDRILREQLKSMFDKYDVVLMDAPPVGLVSDTVNLNSLADKALMVVRFDSVWIKTVKKNMEKLRRSGIEPCGTIITNVKANLGSGYSTYNRNYSSYHRYYGTAVPAEKDNWTAIKGKRKLKEKVPKISKKESESQTAVEQVRSEKN